MNPRLSFLLIIVFLILSNLVMSITFLVMGMSGETGSITNPLSLVGIGVILVTPLEVLVLSWVMRKQNRR